MGVRVWRGRSIPLIAAFASAAFFSALSGTAMMMTPTVLPIALVITSTLTAVIGVPCYAVLRSRLPATWWSPTFVGYAIGVVPIGLLSFLSVPDFASSGGIVMVENGMRTAAGWSELIVLSLTSGLPGAVGGFAFWGTLKATGALTEGEATSRRWFVSALVLALVSPGCGLAFALPTILMDRSCHNSARDGRRSVTPELVAELDVGPTEWDEVRAVMRDFSDDHGWSFRENLEGDVDGYAALHVSVCTEPGIAVSALQHYANPAAFPSPPGVQPPTNLPMRIAVTQERPGRARRASGRGLLRSPSSAIWPSSYLQERGESDDLARCGGGRTLSTGLKASTATAAVASLKPPPAPPA